LNKKEDKKNERFKFIVLPKRPLVEALKSRWKWEKSGQVSTFDIILSNVKCWDL